MEEKKMVGIFRHVEKPFGKNHKYKIITVGFEKFSPMMDVLEETGEIKYSQMYYNTLKNSTTKQKVKHEIAQKFVPDSLQPLYYIYESVCGGRLFVEAKFYKNVSVNTWKGYKHYDKHTINIVH